MLIDIPLETSAVTTITMLFLFLLVYCSPFIDTHDIKVGNIFGPDIDPDAIEISLELTAIEIKEKLDPTFNIT